MNELVRQGKVREIGSSNFSAEQVRDADLLVAPGHARFVSLQNQYSLLERSVEQDVLAEIRERRIGLLPYFPLASGLLSGKYTGSARPEGSRLVNPAFNLGGRFLTSENLEVVEGLAHFARERGRSLLELAFSWLSANPSVASVIAGATKPEQVRQNVAASRWQLTAVELNEIDRLAPLANERAA